jgi:phage-related protein
MTLATFTPPVAPEYGASNKPKIKLLEAEFGDGYTQTARDGVNHIRATWELNWPVLKPTDAEEIETFITEHGGDVAFYWTAPDKPSPQKWTCKDWSFTIAGPNHRSIRATFVQSFNILS